MLIGSETISEILEEYPQLEKAIAKYFKSMCLHCPMATLETLEEGAKAHNVNLAELLSELNELIKKDKGE